VSVPGEEEVLGLEVAMDDALVVSGGQAARDLYRVFDRLGGGSPPSGRRSRSVCPSSRSQTR